MHLPIRSLAKTAFPDRSGKGWFAMLEGYFDDSGTHDDSEVVVWGGLMGDTAQFDVLDKAWRALLMEPIPGRPAIKQFHLSHVVNHWGEFATYGQGEVDLITKTFRDVVISAQLIPVSFSIVLDDWNELVTGRVKELFGSAEAFAFMSCVMSAYNMARISHAPVSFQFDAERLHGQRAEIIGSAAKYFDQTGVNIGFSQCAAVPSLQAADLVAYEAYLVSLNAARALEAGPRLHFVRLLEGAPDAYGFILQREEISRFVTFAEAFLAGFPDGVTVSDRSGFQNVFKMMFGVGGT